MATTKTLTPTNQAITISAFTEKPDNRINATNDDKMADAINTLNSNLGTATRSQLHGETEIKNYLLSVANNLSMGNSKLVSVSSTDTGYTMMTYNTTYEGYLVVSYKSASETHFVWTGYNPAGKDVTFGYANGTWTVNSVNSNIKSAYTNAKILTILVDVTFTNGIGEIDLSDYIPSGYRISVPLASPVNTGSLSVTGCTRKEGSNTIVAIRVGQSYSGITSINILTTLIAV